MFPWAIGSARLIPFTFVYPLNKHCSVAADLSRHMESGGGGGPPQRLAQPLQSPPVRTECLFFFFLSFVLFFFFPARSLCWAAEGWPRCPFPAPAFAERPKEDGLGPLVRCPEPPLRAAGTR